MRALGLLAGFFLDLALGDPVRLPHPVRWMGKLISALERGLRRDAGDGPGERRRGVLLVILVVGGVAGAAFGLRSIFSALSPGLAFAYDSVLIFFSLSVRSLGKESSKVERELLAGDLPRARLALSCLVGRDTEGLDSRGVVRGAVESVAENSVDGVIAPLFYALLGGGPLAISYKAVNTLDSMVGYRDERYLRFGWAAARLDDLANFIPARLSALLLPAAASLTGADGPRALRIALRDGHKHPSPNAGVPEAAVAGALGVQLGGLSRYRGRPSEKPLLGEGISPPEPRHIGRANRMMVVGAFLSLALAELALWLFSRGPWLSFPWG